jgi:drug/metabolite transporter (DMT)-like permease
LNGEIAALIVALVWAVGNIMLKPLSARFRPFFLNYIRTIGAALLFAVFLAVTGQFARLADVPLQSAAIAIAGTFIGIGIGDSLFVLSLRYIDISRAYPIPACGYPLVTIAIAYFALGEELSAAALAGVLMVLAGLFLAAFRSGPVLSGFSLASPRERKGLLLLLFTILSWGVSIIGVKQGVTGVDMPVANFVRFTGAALLLTPLAMTQWSEFRKNSWWHLGQAGFNGMFTFGIGAMFFVLALKQNGAALTSVLSSTSPLFLVALAVVFLKEKVTPRLVAGVVLSVLGIGVVFLF